MRAAHLQGMWPHRFVITTVVDADAKRPIDLVDRGFYAEYPNRLWVADVSYVPTWSGFSYLAAVLDVYSRKVVGWAMENHLRTELVLEALQNAITQRRPVGVIHHSDRGCQYTSYAFGKRCREAGVMPSMGSVGDCGFYQYFGLHHCERKLSWVRQQVQRQWISALNRRGQRRRTNWTRLQDRPWFELPWAQNLHPMV
jgi:transposase InsO family protein